MRVMLLAISGAAAGCDASQSTSPTNDPTRLEHGSHEINTVDMALATDEIDLLKRRAVHGENEAANRLANHYRQARDSENEIRWRIVAANRGDCLSMVVLRDHPSRNSDTGWFRRWNDALRSHRCMHSDALKGGPRNIMERLPLWVDG